MGTNESRHDFALPAVGLQIFASTFKLTWVAFCVWLPYQVFLALLHLSDLFPVFFLGNLLVFKFTLELVLGRKRHTVNRNLASLAGLLVIPTLGTYQLPVTLFYLSDSMIDPGVFPLVVITTAYLGLIGNRIVALKNARVKSFG